MNQPTITLGDLTIGQGAPCLVIPEGCDNHMGSLARAKEMAHAAKEAGASIIKWQLHLPEEEMVKDEAIAASRDMLAKWGSLWDFVVKFRLSPDDHYELKHYCEKIGIQYFCTPFSLKAAQILNQMGVSGFKIGSGEAEDLPMIEEVAKMGRPMILSTGMTTRDEVDLAVHTIRKTNTLFALAHCMSIYAEQTADTLNYGLIGALKARHGVPVGLSDHTPPDPIRAANGAMVSHEARIWATVHQGANFIEKHFTLDRNQPDADSCFSLNPKDLRELMTTVGSAEEAMGQERRVYPQEVGVAHWAKRSVVSAVDIPAGTILTRAMITSKRPGTGIRSKDYQAIIGKTAVRFIPQNRLIQWHDLA